jgi:hypothetical protein
MTVDVADPPLSLIAYVEPRIALAMIKLLARCADFVR